MYGGHTKIRRGLVVTITPSLDLAVIDEAIRIMEALRLREAYRAERRLAAIGARDFYGEEDFIGGVVYVV